MTPADRSWTDTDAKYTSRCRGDGVVAVEVGKKMLPAEKTDGY